MASALMNLGTRAMFAAFSQLQTTSHNIANASVAGYSRQEAQLATAQGQFTGAGFFGKGADVATITRAHDAFLTREVATATALAAGDRARHAHLARLEEVFPSGERGIGHAAGQLLHAMADLASRPHDLATREVVLARAHEVATRFASAGGQLDTLQAGVSQDLRLAVDRVNELAQRVADVNQQIARLSGFGHAPNDLLDERDRLIGRLSEFVAVTTVAADDGTLGVFIAGGQRLVLGNQAQRLTVTPDAMDPSRMAIGIAEAGGLRPLSADLLAHGQIGGLLRFQNEDLVEARRVLDRMAVDFATRVNGQHASGLDLDGDPGAPLFDVATGAAGMRRVLDDPRGIAAATATQVNGNALALAALRDERMVGGETITDAWASAMATVGVRVQGAATAADISAAARVAAERQRESRSGVNLDEEAARLIQFQQSYQAAAKVLQVAQQVFDTLLATAGR
jgi:flagellar hook-associated protein 1 FlgK